MKEQGLSSGYNGSAGLSVIIVNYNSTALLINCISGIKKYFKPEYEIIVVDNNTPGFNKSEIQNLNPVIKVIALNENLGFGKANNLAAEKAVYPYLLLLNPDTEINSDFSPDILSFMRKNPEAGACGPVLYHTDGKIQYSAGIESGISMEILEAFFLINHFRKRFFKSIFKDGLTGKPTEVNWISAACLVIKKNLFSELNGFDPDFFMNYEDIDLCARLKYKGFKNYIFPGLKCTHFDQAVQKRDYRKMVSGRYLSKMIYFKKHFSVPAKMFVILIHILGLFFKLLFVNILYSKEEKTERSKGYRDSLSLSFNAF